MKTSVRPYKRVIAIDGPAASGKSSVARELARKLGFIHVNSGAMYRALTWHVLDRALEPRDTTAVAALAVATRLETDFEHNEFRILIEGSDPSSHLREPRVNRAVSLVSSIPGVREVLVAKMRACALDHDVVMEGRDIGSVVFPEAAYKFYIDAAPNIRAQRRAAEGQTDQIGERDLADSSRRDSPLTVAQDAHVIDSSHLSVADVVSAILERLAACDLATDRKQDV